MRPKLTEQQKQRVIADYPHMSNLDICKKYCVTISWVEALATKYKLRKKGRTCHHPIPIGTRIGDLVVLNKTNKKQKNNIMYECRCSCGLTFLVRSTVLRKGKVSSCNRCANNKRVGQNHHRRTGYGPIGGSMWSKIKCHAHERGIIFNITVEYAVSIFSIQGGFCALSGLPIHFPTRFKVLSSGTASLDRIDNKKGYEVGNVRWVHKHINLMRSNHSDEAFIDLCKHVVIHNKKTNGIQTT